MSTHGQKRLTFALLVSQVDGIFHSPLWKGLERFAGDNQINLVCLAGQELDSTEGRLQNSVYKLAATPAIDGIIAARSTLTARADHEIYLRLLLGKKPAVVLSEPMDGYPCVLADNSSPLAELMDHLITAHGCTRIAFLKGPVHLHDSRERYKAYLQAMARHNLSVEQKLILDGDFQMHSGEDAARVWFGPGGAKPQAVVCSNDEMALGLMETLRGLGLKVPRDVVVTGFDDIDQVKYIRPGLTTAVLPVFDMSYKAGEVLLRMLSGEAVPPVTCLKTMPVIRESCGCNARVMSSERARGADPHQGGWDMRALMDGLKFHQNDYDYFKGLFERLVEALQSDLNSGGPGSRYVRMMEIVLAQINYDGENLSFWKNGMHRLNDAILGSITAPGQLSSAEEIVYRAELAFMDHLVSRENERFTEHATILWKMREILKRFSSSVTPRQLFETIEKSLPEVGIRSACISLFSGPRI